MKALIVSLVFLLVGSITGVFFFFVSNDKTITPAKQQASQSLVVEKPPLSDYVALPKTNGKLEVPILMYHYVRDYTDEADPLGIQLSVSPLIFEAQLLRLKAVGYHSASLNDFANGTLPLKPIIFTFDDGYKDQYQNAFPLLKKYGFTGTFFVIGNFVNQDRYMSAHDIQDMKASGMEIGGHSLSHLNLANASYERAVLEISRSLIGYDNVFCYPSGQYSYETLDIISGLGLKAAVTTQQGLATDQSNLYELPRIRVKEHTDILKTIGELRGIKVPSKASQPSVSGVELQE